MTLRRIGLLVVACLAAAGLARAQTAGSDSGATGLHLNPWQQAIQVAVGAPGQANLLDQAVMRLSEDLLFVPYDGAVKLLEVSHQTAPPDLVGIVVDSGGADWFGILRYSPVGFVPADDIVSWSADDILASIRESGQLPPNHVARGWLQPPTYDPVQHSLTWAVQVVPTGAPDRVSGEAVYHAAIFGRQGYFQIDINTVVDHLDRQRDDVAALLTDIHFLPGHTYADFDAATDPASPKGLPGVLGVTILQRASLIDLILDADLFVPATYGAVLVLGAGLLLLIQMRLRTKDRVRRR